MYSGVKAFLPVILVALVVASSGCINLDPEAFARAMPMVQEFLKEHPNAELHIVHYSATEAEAILDQIKEDCGKTTIEAKEYYFVNITDPDTDLMVRAWIDWETQTIECIYKAGGSRQVRECQSHYKAICFNEHVYWVDSCGNRQEKKEFCPLACRDGRCISEPDKICDPDRIYEYKPECVCPEGYEMLVIYPKCVHEAVQIEAEPTVADFVTGAMTAENDYTTSINEKCIGGMLVYRCVKRNMCRSRAEFRCYSGHVYWFDSCGHRQEKKEYCENGCGLGFCKEKNICEMEGGYCVYPVACTEDAKICPDGTAVGRIPPLCEFAPCPSEGGLEASWQTGYFVPATTGMMIQSQMIPVTETITQTNIYPVPAEEIITGYMQCRPGYVPSWLYCPKNGLCCMPVENKERCFDYTVNDKVERVCATCGNGVCERFEACTPTFCNAAGICTHDCGPLYCPEDCKIQECWDSDGGKNYHKKGVVEAGETRLEDHCNDDGSLTEKYCTEDGRAAAVKVECPEGYECENGACTGKCAQEGEYTSGAVAPEYYYGCCEGLDVFETHPPGWVGGGLLCYDPEKGTPVCKFAGTDDEGWYYSETGDLLRHEECNETYCEDSDGGLEYYEAGYVESDEGVNEDYCDGDAIVEYYCKEGTVALEDYACPHGCEAGACIECAGEGEHFSKVYTDEYPETCCEGLTEWYSGMDTRISIGASCYETGMVAGSPVGTCIECGNGVCEDIEDVCNCPGDCGSGEHSDFATIDEFCSEYAGTGSGIEDFCLENPLQLDICDLCEWVWQT